MPKRWGATPKQVLSWISKGDGQGEGCEYKPFLRVRDVPSSGRSAIVLGLKTGRVHHYFSDLEYHVHLLAEYEPSIIDIREQYALLPWEETQKIAKNLGIRHPVYPGTNTPIVMTSDLVLTSKQRGYGVVCVKPSAKIDPKNSKTKRALEKLLIEKTYWDRRGIGWSIATEKDIPKTRIRNLDTLRSSLVAKELDWLMSYMSIFLNSINKFWRPHLILHDILAMVSNSTGLKRPYCYTLLGRAIWLRLLNVDIDSELINPSFPIKIL